MIEAQIVEAAILFPGKCYTCGQAEGAMVDSMVEIPADGRVYICVDLCLPRFAALAGYLTPQQGADLIARITEAAATEAGLRTELEFERANKLVTVGDALKLADRRNSVNTTPLCSASKADGSPCAGMALPGRDTCVAHSRQPAVAA